jgi:hypothetical protein
MRRFLLLAAVTLVACGNPSAQAPAGTQPKMAATSTATSALNDSAPIWFFCDGIDAPVIYLFGDPPNDNQTRFIEYDKRTGATVRSLDLGVREGDAGAGSIFTPLTNNGAEFGRVRETNSGMLETPGSAYTERYTDLQIEGRNVTCRWLPRTRVAAFTGRRSFVIHEDADGDLIYTTYDFAQAANAHEVDQSENGQTTAFSVEVRGGREQVRPDGSDFTFPGREGYSYHIALERNGAGQLQVLRNGAVVQSEALTAYLVGQGSQH